MDRKKFLESILLGGAGMLAVGTAAGRAPAGTPVKVRLGILFVAGFRFYDGPEVEDLLEAGMPLLLNLQPHNRHDKNAVEVWASEAKLGYLPRPENKEIAAMMRKGTAVKAAITELDPEAEPNGNVKMEVWYELDENASKPGAREMPL